MISPDLGQKISSKSVVSSPWLEVRHDVVRSEGDEHADFWLVERPSFLLVLLEPAAGRVMLLRRFRYLLGRWFWEFPQRRLTEESPECVDRAISALTLSLGIQVRGPTRHLSPFFEAYGFASHRCHPVVVPVNPTSRSEFTSLETSELLTGARHLGVVDAASLAAIALYLGQRESVSLDEFDES